MLWIIEFASSLSFILDMENHLLKSTYRILGLFSIRKPSEKSVKI
jgi:hypothetical protein